MSTVTTTEGYRSFCFLVGMGVLVGVSAFLVAQPRPDQPTATQPTTSAAEQPSVNKAARAEARGSSSGDPEPRREPSASDILKELMKQGREAPKPVVLPKRPGRTTRAEAAGGNAVVPVARNRSRNQKLLPDGYRLVDRPGRLAREGDTYVYTFESHGRGAPEMPIRLLPNRLLEDMEIISAGGSKPVVFVISGEVTEYHGLNYLLVQKLLVRPNLGNLK